MNKDILTKAINIDNKLQDKKKISDDLQKAKALNVNAILTIGVYNFEINSLTVSEMINNMYTNLLKEIQELEKEFAEL